MAATVMIIDDDELILESTRLALEDNGYDVITAFGGREALEVLQTTRPDLILLDVMMPGMDGWEVLRRIKGDEELRVIPVVMLTVKPLDAEALERKETEDLADYITKPFSMEDLIACLREVFSP